MFYLISYLIVLLRVSWFILIWLDMAYKQRESDNGSEPVCQVDNFTNSIGIVDKLATYLELLLGLQQASSMLELYIMIKITLLPI